VLAAMQETSDGSVVLTDEDYEKTLPLFSVRDIQVAPWLGDAIVQYATPMIEATQERPEPAATAGALPPAAPPAVKKK